MQLYKSLTHPSAPHELVTIYVGAEKKPFVIHKEVASYSPALKAAFNSDFIEGQTQTYNLEDAHPGAFQLLVQWLYTKSIQFCLTEAEIKSFWTFPVEADGFIGCKVDTYMKLSRHNIQLLYLWAAADYLQMPRLQNLIVDRLEYFRVEWHFIAHDAVQYLYENLPSEAAIRQLVFEQCLVCSGHRIYQNHSYLFPKQLLVDLIVAPKLREEHNRTQPPQPDPFTDRTEFMKRFHVPEDVESSRNGAD
jgi:hypothetical protein